MSQKSENVFLLVFISFFVSFREYYLHMIDLFVYEWEIKFQT